MILYRGALVSSVKLLHCLFLLHFIEYNQKCWTRMVYLPYLFWHMFVPIHHLQFILSAMHCVNWVLSTPGKVVLLISYPFKNLTIATVGHWSFRPHRLPFVDCKLLILFKYSHTWIHQSLFAVIKIYMFSIFKGKN